MQDVTDIVLALMSPPRPNTVTLTSVSSEILYTEASRVSVFCLGSQGSDHHEGSAERSSDRPQPAEEEIRRSLHALPPDPPQNHRSQLKKKGLTTRSSACIAVVSLQSACLTVDFALLFLFRRLRLRWER